MTPERCEHCWPATGTDLITPFPFHPFTCICDRSYLESCRSVFRMMSRLPVMHLRESNDLTNLTGSTDRGWFRR